jgi:hypothetical protein
MVRTKTGWRPTSEKLLRLDEDTQESAVTSSVSSDSPRDLFGTDSESDDPDDDAATETTGETTCETTSRKLACDDE